jgi:serine/threonine-protein kinase
MPPSDWSTPVLSGIEVELARLIGPVAKVLVRRAARTYKDVDALVLGLLGSLDSEADREAFTRAVTGRALVSSLEAASAPPAFRASTPGPSVTPEDVDRAMKLLTPYIGPIARVVAKRAATPGGSRQDFFVEVARSLETASQRERFLRDAGASDR